MRSVPGHLLSIEDTERYKGHKLTKDYPDINHLCIGSYRKGEKKIVHDDNLADEGGQADDQRNTLLSL